MLTFKDAFRCCLLSFQQTMDKMDSFLVSLVVFCLFGFRILPTDAAGIVPKITTNSTDKAHLVCGKIFPKIKVDANLTKFQNRGCLVHCWLYGHPTTMIINENGTCPYDVHGVCKSGQCTHHYHNNTIGSIEVNIFGAQLDKPAQAIVALCVHNSSVPVSFVTESDPSCVHCGTGRSSLVSKTPQWNSTCTDLIKSKWNLYSRLHFRVLSSTDTDEVFPVGDAVIRITELLENMVNGTRQMLPIRHSRVVGALDVMITFRPDQDPYRLEWDSFNDDE